MWDLESKNLVEDLRPEVPGSARAEPPQVTSLAWSADGQTLFAGYTDNQIRVWQVGRNKHNLSLPYCKYSFLR